MSEADLSVSDEYEQAMPDMDSESYETLKESIRKHGVEYPLLVDADGTVIDGHHRLRAWRELGRDGDPPTIVVNSKDDMERALRANLARRDLSNGAKREAVKGYLERYWQGERTQKEIATDLGVSPQTVTNAKEELEQSGKLSNLGIFSKNEKQRMVRSYVDDHPEASNREVADAVECDVSHATVGNWRHELEAERETAEQPEPEPEPERAFAPNTREREAATDVFNRASEGDETAQREAEKVADGSKPASSAKRTVEQQTRQEQTETPELPDGVYSVLYADPPWEYDFAETSNRAIENQYATLSPSDVADLDVPAADDAVLYLWTTAPKLEQGLDVLRSWGFEYVTNAVWDKQKIGMGYWFRGQHELLLVGKRGTISPPDTDARVSSVISEPRGDHSKKPEAVRELIESAFPDAPKLELFARDSLDGWESWGDEVESSK